MKGLIVETDELNSIQPAFSYFGGAGITVNKIPLICFPMSFILRRGVNDITLALTTKSLDVAKSIFGDGSHLGCTIRYKELEQVSFLANEIMQEPEFWKDESIIYISSNTILWGSELKTQTLKVINSDDTGATVFGRYLRGDHDYETMTIGPCNEIVTFDDCLSYKDQDGYSCEAVPKAGIYPSDLSEMVQTLTESFIFSSLRPVNSTYHKLGRLKHIFIHKNDLWYQINTPQGLQDFQKIHQDKCHKDRTLIGSVELSAYFAELIDLDQFIKAIQIYQGSFYYELLIEATQQKLK
jgi:glucose-1-phosphate thymidylyltransferase